MTSNDPTPSRRRTRPDMPSARERLWRALAGSSRHQRVALRMWATSASTYVAYLLVLIVQVAVGFSTVRAVVALGGLAVVGNAVFYALTRSGATDRRALRTPVAVAQLLFGIAMMLGCYLVSGPAAPSTTIIMASHIIYAAFTMHPTKVKWLTIGSLAALGLAMVAATVWRPDRFPADVQLVAFLYALVVLPLVARLAHAITVMQRELRRRTRQLGETLTELEYVADHDELTRLLNRRSMTTRLAERLAALGSPEVGTTSPLCVALLDLDHFKAINDRFGHAVGDDVLRAFARSATETFRGTDLVGRWGGEEFLVVFEDLPIDRAEGVLVRFRDRLVERTSSDLAVQLEVRFSAGLVEAKAGDALEDVVERADRALYRAKTGGRDTVRRELSPS